MLRKFIALFLTLLPVAIFWQIWAVYVVNIPKWDDHALKAFLLHLEQADSFSERVYQVLRQHNEHRIVLDRIITWLDFRLFGKLDFRHLMTLGNLSLVGLLVVFGDVLRRSVQIEKTVWLLFLPPVSFFLFNLSHWENMFWGMASLQNFTVVLWALWAIYTLTFTQNWPLAIALAVLTTLTSGNGLLIWPIGAGLLVLQALVRRDLDWKRPALNRQLVLPLVCWLIGAAITIGLYFVGYEKPAGNPPVRGSVGELLTGWLAFLGSAAEVLPVGSALTNSVGLGVVLVLAVAVLIGSSALNLFRLPLVTLGTASRPHANQLTLFFAGSVGFLLGTAAIVAWSRVGFGLETLITSRYKLYSLTLLVLVYVAVVSRLSGRGRWLAGGVGLLVSTGLAGLSYPAFTDDVIWWRQWLLTNQFNWTYTTNRPVSTLDATTARWITNAPAFYDRELAGFYRPSDRQMKPINVNTNPVKLAESQLPFAIGPDAGMYTLLRSDRRVYLFSTTPTLQQSARAKLGLALPTATGFSVQIGDSEIDSGRYAVELVQIEPSGRVLRSATGQTLTVLPAKRNALKKNW